MAVSAWVGRLRVGASFADAIFYLIFVAVEVGALGDTMKQSLLKASSVLVNVVPGLTEESVAKMKLALEEPEHKLRLRVYFLAARKR